MVRKRKEGLSRHRQVYETLRKQLQDLSYKEGDHLPSESDLSTTFGLSRPSVRLALAKLEHEGFILRTQGKRSVVAGKTAPPGVISVSGAALDSGDHLMKARTIRKPVTVQWPDPFFFPVTKLEKEAGAICLERVRLYRGEPFFYDETYLPNIRLPRFTLRSFDHKSVFDILRKNYSVEIKRGEQFISLEFADEYVAGLLAVTVGTPLIHIRRRFRTNREHFHIYSSIRCKTDNNTLYQQF